MGVKTVEVSSGRGSTNAMALVYDIDVRWAGAPDISLMFTPSRKWIIKQRKIGASRLASCAAAMNVPPMPGIPPLFWVSRHGA